MPWWAYLIVIAYILFVLAYIYFFMFICLKQSKRRKCLNKFFNILETLYSKEIDIDNAIRQLFLDYNQLCLDNSCECNYKLLELLRLVIYRLDSNQIKTTKEGHIGKLKEQNKFREYVLNLYLEIDKQEPFSILPDKEAALMNNIRVAINSNNTNLSNDLLIQLSNEIQSKEKVIIKEKRQARIATFISIIGLMFTIVFGILSFIL